MEDKINKFFEEKKKEAGIPENEKKSEKLPEHIESFFDKKKAETNLKPNSYEQI